MTGGSRESVRAVKQRGFWHRLALVSGLSGLIGLGLVPLGLRTGSGLVIAFALLVISAAPAFLWWEHRRAVDVLDAEGVTRRDGRRFSWADLRDVERVHVVHKWGQQGALNQLNLRFADGQVRVFPHTLDNGREVMDFIERITAPKPEPPEKPSRANCPICSELSDFHRGFQKHGREEEDTLLPPVCARLVGVRDLTRRRSIVKCPECGTHYLHEIEYEYLATGSEDEQLLTRLSDDEAAAYLAGPGTGSPSQRSRPV